MKAAARILASALIETAAKASAADMSHMVDAVLVSARTHGVSRRLLRRELRRQLRASGASVPAILETVTGDAGPDADAIAKILEKQTGHAAHLQQKASPILGGAILTVGDDRLDWSLAAALRQAEHALRTPSAA